ncbi:hypothetical protein DFH11DRAFT_318023 [Phellopilus nigrolimitatus]|nr:hypothetical protein DFH11DRAFT_318023 [Phellopilus nigrolimitatus]
MIPAMSRLSYLMLARLPTLQSHDPFPTANSPVFFLSARFDTLSRPLAFSRISPTCRDTFTPSLLKATKMQYTN